ncbi:MAG: hypothetical protein VW268_01665 [Rhodospirillaceae bacterium]
MADYSGRSVRDVRPAQLAEMLYDQFQRVVAGGRPAEFERTIRGFQNGKDMRQTVLRMPLSSDGKSVDGVMSVSAWQGTDNIRSFFRFLRNETAPRPIAHAQWYIRNRSRLTACSIGSQ